MKMAATTIARLAVTLVLCVSHAAAFGPTAVPLTLARGSRAAAIGSPLLEGRVLRCADCAPPERKVLLFRGVRRRC